MPLVRALPYPLQRLIDVSFLFGNDFIPILEGITHNNVSMLHRALTLRRKNMKSMWWRCSPRSCVTRCHHVQFTRVEFVDQKFLVCFWWRIYAFWIISRDAIFFSSFWKTTSTTPSITISCWRDWRTPGIPEERIAKPFSIAKPLHLRSHDGANCGSCGTARVYERGSSESFKVLLDRATERPLYRFAIKQLKP